MQINVNINDLNLKQTEIAKLITLTPASKTKYHIVRASRQSGKTFLISRLAVYFSLLKPKKITAFVNAQHKQNRKVYIDMINFIPKEIIQKAINNDGDRSIEFLNGSIIYFFTAQNYNAVVGSTFDYFIGDEFALWPLKAWDYIAPTVAARPKAKVILSSTPRGKNHFYKLCMEGQSKDPFKMEHRMFYSDNEFYDLREVEDAKKSKPESVWRQEYLGEFVFGKGLVFGEFAQYQTLKEWIQPKPEDKYYFGIDVAGSGEDSTILIIINQHGQVCLVYECENTRLPAQVEELKPIILKYNAEGYGECNGLGLGLVEQLEDLGLNISKFWMSNEKKQEMVTLFLKDLHENHLSLPSIELCSKLDNEMSTYEVGRTSTGKLTYHHPSGLHDDTVDSLLIANLYKNDALFGKTTVWDGEGNTARWNTGSYVDELY